MSRCFPTVAAAVLVISSACRQPPADGAALLAEADERRFPLGVASGEATSSSVVLWTKYEGDAPLRAVVWRDGAPEQEVADVEVAPEEGYVHADVSGLEAGTAYAFAFHEMEGDRRSARGPAGRFRTAIAPGASDRLVIGVTSCMKNGRPMTVLEAAGARRDLDLFVLLGDTVYADGAVSRPQYRDKWAENLRTTGFKELRAATSVIATWDDHEFQNDWAGAEIDATRRVAAEGAFYDSLPLRRAEKLWRSFRWGRTAELFVLDSRGERKPGETYLSAEQMAWLQKGLAESPAVFKIILNSVPISDFPQLFDVRADDRWEGYPAQREEILRFIDERRIAGVLWLSGDFHMSSIGRVAASGPGASQVELLVGPAANFANPLVGVPAPPQFEWTTGVPNYAVLQLDPASRELRVTYHDDRGGALVERTLRY